MPIANHELFAAKILIVDDQEANVSLLSQMLTETGYTSVDSTMNPLEVCAMHRKNHYDAILLDLQMPAMDGFELMAALKANVADDYLPVLVITAQPGHKLRALAAGAKDFISKPFDLIEVGVRIRNMLVVRLLYRKLKSQNESLERLVAERTAELRESEARYRSLTELASDWYWEQDTTGAFTRVSGPVLEMLGIRVDPLEAPGPLAEVVPTGYDEAARARLRGIIANREPFLDFLFSHVDSAGTERQFRVSGEPMFDRSCRFTGYRGVGVELTAPR